MLLNFSEIVGMYGTVKKLYVMSKLRASFLRRCIKYNLVPPHANFSLQLEKSLGSSRLTNKFLSSKNTFIIKTLKLEIRDACDRMRYAFSKMYSLSHLVCRCIPTRICNSFFAQQERSIQFLFLKERSRLDKKFKWLLNKQQKKYVNLKPIQYFYNYTSTHPCSPPSNIPKFSLSPLIGFNSVEANEWWANSVRISPPSPLPQSHKNPFYIIDNWFNNLSSVPIPKNVQSLLQLGENFSLSFFNKDKLSIEFIKSIENNISKLPTGIQMLIRNRSVPIFNTFSSLTASDSFLNNELKKHLAETKKFVINNSNLIITRADKGNVSVALNKDAYVNKMEILLGDRNTWSCQKRP